MDTPTLTGLRPAQAGFEIDHVDMYGKYILDTRVDVLYVLNDLVRHQVLATVHFDQGRGYLPTTIIAVDDRLDEVVLDTASDPAINEAAARAGHLLLGTTQGGVKIQFSIDELRIAEHEGRPAFRAPIPRRLLRLQRREYFRLDTPVAAALACQIPVETPSGPQRLSLPILDISGGGLGLMAENAIAHHFAVAAEFPNCRFELPGEGAITAILAIRSAFVVTPGNGHDFTRLGSEFVCLPGSRLTQIQRYITRIERERKARLVGLA